MLDAGLVERDVLSGGGGCFRQFNSGLCKIDGIEKNATVEGTVRKMGLF